MASHSGSGVFRRSTLTISANGMRAFVRGPGRKSSSAIRKPVVRSVAQASVTVVSASTCSRISRAIRSFGSFRTMSLTSIEREKFTKAVFPKVRRSSPMEKSPAYRTRDVARSWSKHPAWSVAVPRKSSSYPNTLSFASKIGCRATEFVAPDAAGTAPGVRPAGMCMVIWLVCARRPSERPPFVEASCSNSIRVRKRGFAI